MVYILIKYCKKLQIILVEHPKYGRYTAPPQVLLACCCTLKSDLLVRKWNTLLSVFWFICADFLKI